MSRSASASGTGRPRAALHRAGATTHQNCDTSDRNLWREYGRVTRSLAAVRWSRGLRAGIGPMAEIEHSDEELAAEDVGGDLLAVIDFPAWSRIRTVTLEHALLVAAERGGLRALNVVLCQAHVASVDCRLDPS
jgi:hypothetical protein